MEWGQGQNLQQPFQSTTDQNLCLLSSIVRSFPSFHNFYLHDLMFVAVAVVIGAATEIAAVEVAVFALVDWHVHGIVIDAPIL
eukprot:m.86102 g.86102  ORF g.86102 m.86102 type:complete len:83 (+) comp8754_c1_seq4:981-1229(+)